MRAPLSSSGQNSDAPSHIVKERVRELEADRDALLASYAEVMPEALDRLSGEERMRVYVMLQLEVRPDPEGYEVSGAPCNKRPRGRRRFDTTKPTELCFRVLLTEDDVRPVQWTRA